MLGAGADVVGIYKSVINIMGLHGGCSPVVPLTSAMSSTLVAHMYIAGTCKNFEVL